MARVWIVDPDPSVASALSAAFRERGHEVGIANTVAQGLEAIERQAPSAVLLCVQDPYEDDWRLFVDEMHARGLASPLLVLGERGALHRHLAETSH